MFEDRIDVRLWAKGDDGRSANWAASSSSLPDVWVRHTDQFGNENRVWISLLIARQFISKASLKISPAQRHAMLELRARGDKVGIVVGVRDTHTLYALRLSPEIFGGDVNFNREIAAGRAIVIDRNVKDELSRAIEFIARDDGVWRPW